MLISLLPLKPPDALQPNVLTLLNLSGSESFSAYHARHALTRQRLLVHVELVGDVVGHGRLILELWAQPCSRHPLASRLAVRTTIGARIGHHIHLKGGGEEGNERKVSV